MDLAKVYVSVGDVNGVGFELILKNHEAIAKVCKPIYCVDSRILDQASARLGLPLPNDLCLASLDSKNLDIAPGLATKPSGAYSFASFSQALELALEAGCGLVTLPVNKLAWNLAGIPYAGHTEYLRARFKREVLMVLGCKDMLVALFSDHVPLRAVFERLTKENMRRFLELLYESFLARAGGLTSVGVLGLNPHAGEGGILGLEDEVIKKALEEVNSALGLEVFVGPLAPDSAFSPKNRERFRIFVAPYHDIGLSALKALYFHKSINLSLNLPLLRVSPDHGTGFDIAYKRPSLLDSRSYLEAIDFVLTNPYNLAPS